ncbi:SDR family oxidoreductase [Aurantibacter crassamenti]|uniref:SDR family oxidoreductase n=1 Tax=Aurantibacter crassamenti TaxID=1837375 RepID=UPI0019399E8D|nr:SDR family oxidoreductase [Aurantibacter crassamenti]MBM1106796.1 SDR family oxidoreductase [Aurantibacter crassamenti]
MENILVVGATGTTGKKVVNLLKASQYFEPIAMVRKESQIPQFEAQKVKTVLGNLEEDIAHTMKDIDKVVFTAGSGGKKVIEVDQEGAKKMVDASRKASLKKFIMLSSMGADSPEKASELQEYLKAKHNADEYLKSNNIPYTIIRPGSLTNEKGEGKITLEKSLTEQGSISRDDVAQVLTRVLHDDALQNKTVEIISGNTLIGKALDSVSAK